MYDKIHYKKKKKKIKQKMRIPITQQTTLTPPPHADTHIHNNHVEEMYNAAPHTELNILSASS